MRTYILTGTVALLLMGAHVSPVRAETTATTSVSLADTLKSLLAQIEDLKAKLADLQNQVKDVIRTNVGEGTSGDDVKEVQKLLATDPSIYPQGLVTGYFGPLTKEALKRLQKRHDLPETGVIDADTHDLLESYLKERFGEDIPPGLLRAPGIEKKVELRVREGCDNRGPGTSLLCEHLTHPEDDAATSTDDGDNHDGVSGRDHEEDDNASSTDDDSSTHDEGDDD